MRRTVLSMLLAITLAGCGSSTASPPTPTIGPTQPPVTATRGPAPTPTVTIGKPFATFLNRICSAFARGDAGTIEQELPHFQYNSGLRYGMLGDGEGTTGDPSLLRTWLQASHPHCVAFTPGLDAHGTVLTVGWKAVSTAALLDLDIFNGRWKINDFTFGGRAALEGPMHTSSPILPYHG